MNKTFAGYSRVRQLARTFEQGYINQDQARSRLQEWLKWQDISKVGEQRVTEYLEQILRGELTSHANGHD